MREDKEKKIRKESKGFTLVELVIVVAVMAILVGILAPQYIKYVERARKAADMQNLTRLVDTFKMQVIDSGLTRDDRPLFTPGHSYAFVMWYDHTSKKKDLEFKMSRDAKRITEYISHGTENTTNWADVPHGSTSSEHEAMNEVLGENWKRRYLKSSKWGTPVNSLTKIWVICYITPDESIEVIYCPLVQEYLKDEDGVSTK